MGGKPSKGTPADKRLKSNSKGGSAPAKSGTPVAAKSALFGGKKAAPFAKGGGRKK